LRRPFFRDSGGGGETLFRITVKAVLREGSALRFADQRAALFDKIEIPFRLGLIDRQRVRQDDQLALLQPVEVMRFEEPAGNRVADEGPGVAGQRGGHGFRLAVLRPFQIVVLRIEDESDVGFSGR
jgi:hypothetical protein